MHLRQNAPHSLRDGIRRQPLRVLAQGDAPIRVRHHNVFDLGDRQHQHHARRSAAQREVAAQRKFVRSQFAMPSRLESDRLRTQLEARSWRELQRETSKVARLGLSVW